MRSYEIEALMDEEIRTIARDKLKPYQAMITISEALPALGIVAAVLSVIKAMGALDQSPEVLGHLIGAALVGTFAGIFFSYGVIGPIANKIKSTREKNNRLYIVVKQTLLAYMNGSCRRSPWNMAARPFPPMSARPSTWWSRKPWQACQHSRPPDMDDATTLEHNRKTMPSRKIFCVRQGFRATT